MKNLLLAICTIALFACNDTTQTTVNQTVNQKPTKTTKATAKTVSLKNGIGVGDKAPEFELKGIDGQMHSFATIKDANGEAPKGYIVIFTCNTCPVAKMNEQRIIALQEAYGGKGYPVVAIQPNDPAVKPGDSFEVMQSYAKDKNFNFLYLFDDGQKVYPQYGATRTPEVFLVDKDLTVRYHGAIDNSARNEDKVNEKFLENAIQAIEAGKEPTPAKTKAVGCSIKTA